MTWMIFTTLLSGRKRLTTTYATNQMYPTYSAFFRYRPYHHPGTRNTCICIIAQLLFLIIHTQITKSNAVFLYIVQCLALDSYTSNLAHVRRIQCLVGRSVKLLREAVCSSRLYASAFGSSFVKSASSCGRTSGRLSMRSFCNASHVTPDNQQNTDEIGCMVKGGNDHRENIHSHWVAGFT
jgi:hypothetical protein